MDRPATPAYGVVARSRAPSPQAFVLEATLLILGFVLLGLILYAAQFSGGLRWLLVLWFLVAFALVIGYEVVRRSSNPVPLLRDLGTGGFRPGELTTLAAAVRRADNGLVYSQMAVSSRVRDAFEERVRLSLNLPFETMRFLQQTRPSLSSIVGDDALADFMVLRTSSMEERYRWVRDARGRRGFSVELRDVLDRMEAWR